MKKIFAKIFARYIRLKESRWINNPIKYQQNVFKNLILTARNTNFGKDHDFKSIKNYDDFKLKVPIHDYEKIKPPYTMRIFSVNSVS